MLIERTRDEIIIRLPSSVGGKDLESLVQQVIDYGKYLETTAKSKAKQSDADQIAEEANAARYRKTKRRSAKHS